MVTWATQKMRARNCRACGTAFRPMHQHDYKLCWKCDFASHPAGLVDCPLCGRDNQPPAVDARVAACRACAKAPAKRPALIKALLRGKELRIAATQEHLNA